MPSAVQGIDKEIKKGSRAALWEAVHDTYVAYKEPMLPRRGTPAVTPRFKLASLRETGSPDDARLSPRKHLVFE